MLDGRGADAIPGIDTRLFLECYMQTTDLRLGQTDVTHHA